MNITQQDRILVVAAHPDDEVLGCGGTIALAKSKGAFVSVLFLGEGISARFPYGDYGGDDYKEQHQIRQNGSKKALKVLGVDDVIFGERLCCQFDTIPQITLTKEIESVLDKIKPTILLTHNPSEVNIDHLVTYNAVEVACRPTRSVVPNEIYGFEVVCSGSWKFDSDFLPNVFVDIEKFWERKLDAWNCYEGENRPFPFPRSVEGLETLARYRGMASNLRFAEALRLLRKVVK